MILILIIIKVVLLLMVLSDPGLWFWVHLSAHFLALAAASSFHICEYDRTEGITHLKARFLWCSVSWFSLVRSSNVAWEREVWKCFPM